MQQKVKVLPISDIHGNFSVFNFIMNNNYSPDLITISGDIYFGHNLEPLELVQTMEKFQSTMNCPIIIIQGNHDYWLPNIFSDSKDIHILHNEGIEILNLKIWGSPNTPIFLNWNHMMEDGIYGLDNIFKNMMPDDLDILLSHGPPYGYGDTCRNESIKFNKDPHLGSKSLYEGILIHKPRYVFCGHIHTGIRKTKIIHKDECSKNINSFTEVYNVSVLDENYKFNRDNPIPEIIIV